MMAEPVYKMIELVGTSQNSISEAIENAIARANVSLRHLGWFEVTQIRGALENGVIKDYQVALKAGFRLDDNE
jgi:flavin-binding protein dodecin